MGSKHGRRLPHGYTNSTIRDGNVVEKTYEGADRTARHRREVLALTELSPSLPVAEIANTRPGVLTMGRVEGRHGQDLIDAGEGTSVMHVLGRLLRSIQEIVPSFYPEYDGHGVLVHGDFGPNNALFDEGASSLVLCCDWEWSTVGDRLTDLAWAEFTVRMHHPDYLDCIHSLFAGYGTRPDWQERQAAMINRAAQLEQWARSSGDVQSEAEWRRRSGAIATWAELPEPLDA